MSRGSISIRRGGIATPQGFLAAGIHAGVKKTEAFDLALVVSERPGSIAGVFTTNQICAAPVTLDRAHLTRGEGQAIIVNSGNANACTGPQGLHDAHMMVSLVANRLAIPTHRVFVSSTGVIGQFLPMPAIHQGIPLACSRLRKSGGRDAARAIMTTDTFLKEVTVHGRLDGTLVIIGGMAKGSGMIHPDMATMLAFLSTDANVEPRSLQAALTIATNQSFNCISVDGDTSTNDTVLCLANGVAGNSPLSLRSPEFPRFQDMLNLACRHLALLVCKDGEGMTKLIELHVRGTKTEKDARTIARTVSTSALVKTAVFGEDANWGRIMAAIGRAGVPLSPEKIKISFDRTPIVRKGMTLGPTAERLLDRIVKRKQFTITIDLGLGSASCTTWFTDLSFDYVKINASYRS
jgi:glutamate N-acetyltransferase/amino-acid N-acetyltransferase